MARRRDPLPGSTAYEYVRHRRVSSLNLKNAPMGATHVATCPQGFKWFIGLEVRDPCPGGAPDHWWWIQPSNQYGTGYAHCSLFQDGCTLEPLKEDMFVLLPSLVDGPMPVMPKHDDELLLYIDNNKDAFDNVLRFMHGERDTKLDLLVTKLRSHLYDQLMGPVLAASHGTHSADAEFIRTALQELLDTTEPYARSYIYWDSVMQHYRNKLKECGPPSDKPKPESLVKQTRYGSKPVEKSVRSTKANGKRKLNDTVVKAFANILFDTVGCLAILPTSLGRELYLAVKDVMEDYGGKYQTNRSAFKFPNKGSMIRMQTEVAGGESHNQKSKHQAFYTPPAVVHEMLKLAQVKKLEIALEPSAGYGAIARALRDAGAIVTCVETSYDAAEYLRKDGFPTKHCNFLTVSSDDLMTKPSVIVMNPPFTKAQDATHVRHAWMLLKPGGRLVSVVSKAAETNSRKEYRELRKLVKEHGEFVDLRAGSFRESGTSVSTSLVVLRKPKE